jgi:periplasmic divalent cation tolerance protein
MILIQTTTSTKIEAKKIANILLEKKLTACVQISKIDSMYTWENKLCEEEEYLLLIKTKKSLYKEIQREIKENHSYDVPEIIGVDITHISNEYQNFIEGNTI